MFYDDAAFLKEASNETFLTSFPSAFIYYWLLQLRLTSAKILVGWLLSLSVSALALPSPPHSGSR